MYLVMEYCSGGDLAKYIRRHKRIPEVAARALLRQLSAGLRELWSRNLVHVRSTPGPTSLNAHCGPACMLPCCSAHVPLALAKLVGFLVACVGRGCR